VDVLRRVLLQNYTRAITGTGREVIRRRRRACQIFCVSWGSRCPFVILP
jgi:hypothetical protein